jgi:diguanylate cyclase (GGDEF)-like protein
MKTVLLVDDDPVVLSILEKKILSKIKNIKILKAYNYKESIQHILNKDEKIDAAIVDLYLPGVKVGIVVDFALKKEIPTFVLTADDSIETEKSMLEKPIVEYIRKSCERNIDYAVKSIDRILKNFDTNILIVDDSPLQLKTAIDIIKKMRLNITTAMDGKEAMEIINKGDKKFSIVLTDYNMPNMDGMELTAKIREKYDKDELSIIVLSINDSPEIPTKFLKMGANDFINKPFSELEVVTRINSNLEILDLFQKTIDMANKDFLTGVFNRRYFFDSGNAIFLKANRKQNSVAVAMFDIDHFKVINDTYGHNIGDMAIKKTTEIISENIRSSDLMARFGGEEFCILLEDITLEDAKKLFEKIRDVFEKNVIRVEEDENCIEFSFTVSIGVCYGIKNSLEDMINISDKELYKCKQNGRNQISVYVAI